MPTLTESPEVTLHVSFKPETSQEVIDAIFWSTNLDPPMTTAMDQRLRDFQFRLSRAKADEVARELERCTNSVECFHIEDIEDPSKMKLLAEE